jgi:hypothetical protein
MIAKLSIFSFKKRDLCWAQRKRRAMSIAPQTVLEPARTTELLGEFDIVVLGGGPAGMRRRCGALGRRRSDRTRYGAGGMGTAGVICVAFTRMSTARYAKSYGCVDDLLGRVDRWADSTRTRSSARQRRAYDTWPTRSPRRLLLSLRVEILFHALAGVAMDGAHDVAGENRAARRCGAY